MKFNDIIKPGQVRLYESSNGGFIKYFTMSYSEPTGTWGAVVSRHRSRHEHGRYLVPQRSQVELSWQAALFTTSKEVEL